MMACIKYLVSAGLAVLVLAVASQASVGPSETSCLKDGGQNNTGQNCTICRSKASGVQADSFNVELCGKSNIRDWRRNQSAFGCVNPESEADNVGTFDPGHVKLAVTGEFPFFVLLSIKLKGKNREIVCSGTIIDANMVLTSAGCLKVEGALEPERDIESIKLQYGYVNAGKFSKTVIASRWCWNWKFLEEVYSLQLAAIQIDEPLEPFIKTPLIQPACFDKQHYHKELAQCVIVGYGPLGFKSSGQAVLQSVRVRRNSSAEDYMRSYSTDLPVANNENFNGGPVVCYDRCANNRDDSQAFIVGVVSYKSVKNHDDPETRTYDVTDLTNHQIESQHLEELVYMVKRGWQSWGDGWTHGSLYCNKESKNILKE